MLKGVYCICYKFFRTVLCDYISGLRVSFCLAVEFFFLCFFLLRHLRKCLMEYGTTEYSEWVLAHPGQAVLTVVSK